MKLAWASDIHLDHLRDDTVSLQRFIDECNATGVDHLVITGDISNSQKLRVHLEALDKGLAMNTFLVLGNHDMWFSSRAVIQRMVGKIAAHSVSLSYLSARNAGHTALDEGGTIALIGVDGWYDGRAGLGSASHFTMNDWRFIGDYSVRRDNIEEVVRVSQQLADADTVELLRKIDDALKVHYRKIVIATHVPPWVEAHLHEGLPGEPAALPWYTNQLMGRMIQRVAQENPGVDFLVLAGHTHGASSVKIEFNLECRVAGAEYGQPRVEVIEI